MKLYRSHTAITAILPLILLILFVCACQRNAPPAPTGATIPPETMPALPATATFAIPSPTVLPPTSTPEASATPGPTPPPETTQATLTAGGPWLLYQRNLLNTAVGGFSQKLLVSNQDGSGSRVINETGCETGTPISITADPANRLVVLSGKFVLINLDRAVVQFISPACQTRFTGSAAGGWLATIDRTTAEAALQVYELPEGKLHSTYPIPSCSGLGQACGFDTDSGTWVAQWDTSGHRLIFPAILDGARSDLYLYDAQNSETRKLASIPGRVSRIWWSPGGTNILLGVSPGGDFFIESFWVVPVAGGEAHQVSTAGENLNDVELLDWLDENRFLFYSGSLKQVMTLGASNLRMLDSRTNKETTLLGDGFLWAGLDRQTGIVGMIVAVYNGQFEDGVYLVPAAKPTPQKIAPVETEGIYNTFWDEGLHLFVTGDPCQDGGQGFRAFDSKGGWQCTTEVLPKETLPVVDSPAPDGQWRAVMKDGLWVESTGQPAVKVHRVTPTQVIWRLDSGGFFFIANTGLFYVSLPDLAIHPMDDPNQLENGLQWGSDQMKYQWIDNGNGR